MSETALVKACLQLLALRGIPAWRNNSGALPVGKRFVRFGHPGSSDILGILAPAGRLLAVECKTATGRLSPAQRAFLDNVTAAGGLALVVKSIDQLDEALRLEGVGEVPCERCEGTGVLTGYHGEPAPPGFHDDATCHHCDGTGRKSRRR